MNYKNIKLKYIFIYRRSFLNRRETDHMMKNLEQQNLLRFHCFAARIYTIVRQIEAVA